MNPEHPQIKRAIVHGQIAGQIISYLARTCLVAFLILFETESCYLAVAAFLVAVTLANIELNTRK